MARITEGTVHVFTYKDGSSLLSPLAHDLQILVERFSVEVDGDSVRASFEPQSFQVLGPIVKGKLQPDGLSAKHKREIHGNINGSKILDSGRHGEIRFEGRVAGSTVSGQLTLHGKSQPVEVELTHADGRYRGQVALQPTRWGIKPYKALLGAIKLKDALVVRFDLPAPA